MLVFANEVFLSSVQHILPFFCLQESLRDNRCDLGTSPQRRLRFHIRSESELLGAFISFTTVPCVDTTQDLPHRLSHRPLFQSRAAGQQLQYLSSEGFYWFPKLFFMSDGKNQATNTIARGSTSLAPDPTPTAPVLSCRNSTPLQDRNLSRGILVGTYWGSTSAVLSQELATRNLLWIKKTRKLLVPLSCSSTTSFVVLSW